jgi:carboxylate-amine ligase
MGAMEADFGGSSEFTVGIEEELLLVEPEEYRLSHTSDQVLTALNLDERSARHDLYAAQVELSTPPSASVDEAVRSLLSLRAAVSATGATVIGAGIHPSAGFGDVEITDADRYREAARDLGGIARRTPDCALHVHVGMPDADTAIRVCNGLREHLPLLEALAANSPFWHGLDSGHASARRVLRRSFPRVAPPPPFRDFADYQQRVERSMAAAGLPDYTFVWWEVRPHPRFGTVEVRAMDSQSSIASVAGIAAFVQALARQLAEGDSPAVTGPELLEESSFRAGRDGLRAHIHDVWGSGSWAPVPDLLAQVLDRVRPHARELGVDGPLEELERIAREGNGADRQRLAQQSGGMAGVLQLLVAETRDPRAARAGGAASFRNAATGATS